MRSYASLNWTWIRHVSWSSIWLSSNHRNLSKPSTIAPCSSVWSFGFVGYSFFVFSLDFLYVLNDVIFMAICMKYLVWSFLSHLSQNKLSNIKDNNDHLIFSIEIKIKLINFSSIFVSSSSNAIRFKYFEWGLGYF